MKENVGSCDAAVRFLVGCGVLFMGANGFGWWALLGFVPILSAAFERCPIYFLLGVNTARAEESVEERLRHPHDGHLPRH